MFTCVSGIKCTCKWRLEVDVSIALHLVFNDVVFYWTWNLGCPASMEAPVSTPTELGLQMHWNSHLLLHTGAGDPSSNTTFQCNHIYLFASTRLTSHRLMYSGFIRIAAYVNVPASSSLDNISLHVDATFHLWHHLLVEQWVTAKFRYGKQCRECENNAISEHLAVSSAVYILRGIAGNVAALF